MNDLSIYKGEDFAFVFEAFADDGITPEDISGYDILAQISTTPLGGKVIASTTDKGQIQIARRGNSVFAINVNNALTSKLSEGMITLSIMLQHKQTKVQIIAEAAIVEIKQSRLTNTSI